MTVTGDGGKAIEQSTFVRRDADDYDETGGRVDWIRATFAVWKRPQVTGGAPRVYVCDIGDDVDPFVGVGVQPDPFVVGRVIGLLDCEVSPKYGRSVGLCGYSGLSVDLACDGAVLPDLYGLAVEWPSGTTGLPPTIRQGRCISC